MTPQSANPHSETPAGSPNPTPELQASVLPGLAALDGSNGSTGRPSRTAKAGRWSKRTRLVAIVAAVVLVLGGTAAAYIVIEKPFQKKRTDLVTRKVMRGTLPLRIVERGQLESANNSDIICQVKAKNQGGTVATTIRWLVDDGTRVKYDRPKDQVKDAWVWEEVEEKLPLWDLPVRWPTGVWRVEPVSSGGRARCVKVRDPQTKKWIYADVVMELDDSSLQDQLVTQKIALDGAEDDALAAEKTLGITLAQAKADIKAAEIVVQVAEINLKKYTEPGGDYTAKHQDLDSKIKSAQSDRDQQIDRVAWANRMLKKGFQTASQAQSEQLKLESYELTLGVAQANMRVLEKYEKKQQEITLRGEVEKQKANLANIRSKYQDQETKDRSALNTKKSVLAQQQGRYKDILEQIQKCKISAPRTGIAVYYIPEQARWGVGARQSIVAQGESVNEGQKMMQIPDLEHMMVSAKVHEALAPKVHRGQKAVVRVESFYDQPLEAKVEFVATMASSADFLSADVRVYNTKVAITTPIEGLRPGSNAEVAITIGDAIIDALLVPIEAVVGGPEMGKERTVFVMTPDGPKERKVIIGASNTEYVQIKEGLEEDEEVVLNPKLLVGDKVKTRKAGEGNGVGPENQNGGPGGKRGQKPGAGGGRPGPGGPGRPSPGSPGQPGAGGPGGPGGGQMDPQQMQEALKKFQALQQRLRNTPKEKRKAIFLQEVQPQYRERAKQGLEAAGIEIPD